MSNSMLFVTARADWFVLRLPSLATFNSGLVTHLYRTARAKFRAHVALGLMQDWLIKLIGHPHLRALGHFASAAKRRALGS